MGDRLQGHVAILTGAAGGLGRGLAARLVQEGARVVLADQDEAVKQVAPDIKGSGEVVSVVADLSTPDEARETVVVASERWGRVDILVNNAGGGVIRPFLEHDSESIEVTLSRNLRTTINCSRSVLPVMRSQGYGRIVNIGADSVRSGLYAHAIYNAAKGGVSGMAVGLARECAPDGITVNVVAPGGIAGVHTRPAEETHLEKASAQALELIPMRRLGEIAEVAHAVVFLASPEASYITGQVLAVNGGCTMG